MQSSLAIGISANRDINNQYTSINIDDETVDTDEDLLDYTKFNDSIEVLDSSEDYARVITKDEISKDQFSEISEVTPSSETIEVIADTEYHIDDEIMSINLEFIDNNKVIENIRIEANVMYDLEGNIEGSFVYDGVKYDIAEVLSMQHEGEMLIETFAVSTALIVGLVAGAVIGGVTGAVISYNKYNTIKWRYVVGGAVIGAAFGAATGYGVGLMHGGTVSMTSAVSNVAKNPSNLKITKTVANHIPKRSYINSKLLVSEIIKSVRPTKDVSLKNGLRWVTPGTHNGTKGVWELVIDMDSKTIVHYLFRK